MSEGVEAASLYLSQVGIEAQVRVVKDAKMYSMTIPGLGGLMVDSIRSRDYPIISSINLMLAGFVLIVNLLVDISYAWFDPRIHYK